MEQSPLQPTPVGAFRFNTDSSKMEYYDGNQWVNITSTSPEAQTGGTRGLLFGRYNHPASYNVIDYIQINTTGDSIDFGDITGATYYGGAFASRTRGIYFGGYPETDNMCYVTIASTGDTADFGNLSVARRNPGAVSNQTRGVVAGGGNVNELTVYDTMDYVTIASTGHAVDFGNKTNNIMTPAGSINSPTRGVFAAGASTAPSYTETNVMDYITIASTGHAQDFGDLRQATAAPAGCSNAVRGIIAGGATDLVPGQTLTADISYLTIATTGNAMDFGDLIVATNFGHSAGMSSPVRGVFACGYVAPGPSATRDTIQYIAIATQGNAVDFGDSVTSERYRSANSNAHGGL